MTSKRYDVSRIIEAKEAAGGWNELAKLSGINRGTLKYVGEGKRNPSPKLAERLLKVGLIESIRKPRPSIPWRKVAVWLADNPANMVTALVIHGVDREKSEQIAARIWE